jgi:putative phage-type endonuclease
MCDNHDDEELFWATAAGDDFPPDECYRIESSQAFLPVGFTFTEIPNIPASPASPAPASASAPAPAPAPALSPLTCITRDMQLSIVKRLRISGPEDIRRICAYTQRTPEWFTAREHRLTGSRAGTACKMNPYESPDKLLCEMMWPNFKGNAATRNGTKCEPFAAKSLLRIVRLTDPGAQLAIPGLIVSQEESFMAYSADGVLLYSDGTKKLVEIKTPVKRKPYPSLPPMYKCQIQLGMHILNLESCVFVTYCGTGRAGRDDETHIQEFKRDDEFLRSILLPRLRTFFFTRYLPLRVCFEHGMLRQNQFYVPNGVSVEKFDAADFN